MYAHGQFSVGFELIRLVLSKFVVVFLNQKYRSVDTWETLLLTYCTMDNAGSMVVVIYRGKSREVCTVLLDKGLFLKNQTTLAKILPLALLKTVDLEYHSSLSIVRINRIWLKSLQIV